MGCGSGGLNEKGDLPAYVAAPFLYRNEIFEKRLLNDGQARIFRRMMEG
jgi:hypothetical protein